MTTDNDVNVWAALPAETKFVLLGLGLVELDDDGRPNVDELPAEVVARINRDMRGGK